MALVVDANVLFSSLIKAGITRELMLSGKLVLYTPELIVKEFLEHIEEVVKKTHAEKDILKEKVKELIIQSDLKIIPKHEIEPLMSKAKKISPDPDDAIYFALALKLNCAIWSNDKKLKEQNRIKVYSTEDLVKMI